MITIMNALIRRGYSSVDHYITGDEFHDVIGRSFRSVGEASKSVRSYKYKNVGHKSLKYSPILLTVCFASGEVKDFSVF